MHPWPTCRALLVLAALVSPSASADSLPHVTFATPAQIDGKLELGNLKWALIVFPEVPGQVKMSLHGIQQVTNHSLMMAERESLTPLWNSDRTTFPLPDASVPSEPNWIGEVRLGKGYSSLLVVAEKVQLFANGHVEIQPLKFAAEADSYLPPLAYPFGTTRYDAYPVGGDMVPLTLTPSPGSPFAFSAKGIQSIEWFNVDVDCRQACFPGGGINRLVAAPGWRGDTYSYIAVQTLSGELEGKGVPLAIAAGGTAADLGVAGYLRLPNATLEGKCGKMECPNPDGQTLRASGALALKSLEWNSAGRLQANLHGEVQAVAFDERAFGTFSTKAAVISTTAVLGLLVVAKMALAFFTRHQRPALDNPRIRQTFDLIVGQPGRSFSDLRRLTGAGTGDLKRQVTQLLAEGLVVAREYRNTLRFFENHGRYDANWQGHAALQDESTRLLHDWLLARPGSTQLQMRATDAAFTKGVVQKGLKRLQEAGLVEAKRDGRNVYYWAHPAGKP